MKLIINNINRIQYHQRKIFSVNTNNPSSSVMTQTHAMCRVCAVSIAQKPVKKACVGST